jgi:hypothetical protein
MTIMPTLTSLISQSPRIRLLRIFILTASLLTIPIALDFVFFRSHLYLHVIEPESTAGITALAPFIVTAAYNTDRSNVLVVGDSRVGEGFSRQIANATVGDQNGLNFISLGMAGTTPRVWYYLLREIDVKRDRFSTIVLVLPTLRSDEIDELMPDRILDTAYLAPFLRIADYPEYADSFISEKARRDATLKTIFPPLALQRDVAGFLAHPLNRYKKSQLWRNEYPEWAAKYVGNLDAMPLLNDEQLRGNQNLPLNLAPTKNQELASYLELKRHLDVKLGTQLANARFYSEWLAKIAARYSGRSTRILIALAPRGPYSEMLFQDAQNAQHRLLDINLFNSITVLPTYFSTELERPQYFFDVLHLNKSGRAAFSAALSKSVIKKATND